MHELLSDCKLACRSCHMDCKVALTGSQSERVILLPLHFPVRNVDVICNCSINLSFPPSARGPSPHGSPRRHPWGLALLEGWRLRQAGAGLVQGHQHASGVRLISVPPIQACWQHAWCLACVEICPLGGRAP